jgi:hypothetical protein
VGSHTATAVNGVFSPGCFYAVVFSHDFNVTAAVRLNEIEYDAGTFGSYGIRHHHVKFDMVSSSRHHHVKFRPDRVAAAFLDAANAALESGESCWSPLVPV